jgi:hypothetical protein
LVLRHHPVLARVSPSYPEPLGRFPRVTHPCATNPEGSVRLACVRHAASVRSEPGSNSQVCVTTIQARAKRHAIPHGRTSRSRYLHLSNVWIRRTCSDNDLKLTGYQSPEAPRNQAPSPTCPFIKPTMSKNHQHKRRTTKPPRSCIRGLPSVPSGDREASQPVSQRPVGETAYMDTNPTRQCPFWRSEKQTPKTCVKTAMYPAGAREAEWILHRWPHDAPDTPLALAR